jgi:hypothetical protein
VIVDRPPPPHVTWTQEPLVPGVGLDKLVTHFTMGRPTEEARKDIERRAQFVNNPGVLITASPDDSWSNPAFAAECDRPCESINAMAMTGGSSVGQGRRDDRTVIIQFIQPGLLPANVAIKWEIRSLDKESLHIKNVAAVRLK